jgi:uncharacterized membrane protein
MSRNFNFIYSKLVEAENDLIGIIAYSLYKREKVKFIENKKENSGEEEVSDQDLKYFHDISNLRSGDYRKLAEGILTSYLNEALDGTIADLEQDANEKLTARVNELKTPFWLGVLQSLLGSICFVIFLGAIIMMLVGSRVGYDQIVMEMIRIFRGASIEETHISNTPRLQ